MSTVSQRFLWCGQDNLALNSALSFYWWSHVQQTITEDEKSNKDMSKNICVPVSPKEHVEGGSELN